MKNSLKSTNSSANAMFHALLVGVGDYAHSRFANLPATVRDAQALAEILTNPKGGGYPSDNVRTIIGPEATAANLRAALKHLGQVTDTQSTAFVYFSGHGGRTLPPGGANQGHAYLCPREAVPDDLPNTAISGDEFSAALAAIPARRVVVVLDACHAAGSATLKAADGAVWKAGLPESYYAALSQGSGRVIIASSKEDQFSRVQAGGKLSLFTHHLRQALMGGAAVREDGLIHVLDVFHYVNQAVTADEPKQTPILKVDDLDLNFPIALVPDQTSEPAKAPGAPESPKSTPSIAAIREHIVRDPIAGAKALSAYLAERPEHGGKRDEVDLKRAELERIQHGLDLFGPNPADKAAKNRVVFYLLRICQDLDYD
jgi:hypothetical protein